MTFRQFTKNFTAFDISCKEIFYKDMEVKLAKNKCWYP